MDNRYYGTVINEMSAFFEENGFKEENACFSNGKNSVKIEYDEQKQLYNLLMADVEEGKAGEYATITSYLFDDSQLEKDAASVGIDFVDTLKKKLGVKTNRKTNATSVDLPVALKGEAVTVTTLTSKLLAVYPGLKGTYKEETVAKGKYLYLDFMTTYFVPEIRATLESGNKKSIKKLIDMLLDMFIMGDNATSTAVVAILTAAIGKNEQRFIAATEHMSDCSNLIASINNQIALLGKNKKFTEALKYKE